jgi:uncharacterized protein (DUF2147 family)
MSIPGPTRTLAVAMILAAACVAALAARPNSPTPVGAWKTVDDQKGDVRSIVKIDEKDGELSATVQKTFPRPGEEADPKCDKCPDEFKDKPIIGLRFMWGLKGQGRDWDGGKILDPDNGKIYRVKLHLSDDGRTLEVRGYLGFSMFGRTQTWHRAEP